MLDTLDLYFLHPPGISTLVPLSPAKWVLAVRNSPHGPWLRETATFSVRRPRAQWGSEHLSPRLTCLLLLCGLAELEGYICHLIVCKSSRSGGRARAGAQSQPSQPVSAGRGPAPPDAPGPLRCHPTLTGTPPCKLSSWRSSGDSTEVATRMGPQGCKEAPDVRAEQDPDVCPSCPTPLLTCG